MDPRSPATPEVLAEQFQLGKEIFSKTLEARRALAEISSLQKRLAGVEQGPAGQAAQFKSALTEVESSVNKIVATIERSPQQGPGLRDAYNGLASALQVVESGDRPVPTQAVSVYQQSSQQVDACIREWAEFKQVKLPQFNQQLRRANLAPITLGKEEQGFE
jgi:hypothetical protein